MNKKMIAASLLTALALTGVPSDSSAEQAAAEQYRQMFRAEEFYLEYKDLDQPKAKVKMIAAYDQKRMERAMYPTPKWMNVFNPLSALFSRSDNKYPDVLNKDGKYYQFLESDRAIELDEARVDDENLDPRQGWSDISQKLAVPIELAVFYWNDPYRPKTSALEAPIFLGSSKLTVGRTEYDCDRYSSAINRANGSSESQLIYEMLYLDGRLREAHLSIEEDGIEYPISRLQIRKLSGEIPKKLFKIKRNAKTYAAGTGDMSDLLEQPKQVGTMEGI